MEVITASDGQEALELAKAHLPELVFTDYQMPFLSGLELCEKLKSDPATRHIPAIMLTARGFSLSDQELADTNIRKVLVKPFSPREVLRTVQEVLEGHEGACGASSMPRADTAEAPLP
jgi:two-component system alkaline phosphatase synthesis response regulator PhoP